MSFFFLFPKPLDWSPDRRCRRNGPACSLAFASNSTSFSVGPSPYPSKPYPAIRFSQIKKEDHSFHSPGRRRRVSWEPTHSVPKQAERARSGPMQDAAAAAAPFLAVLPFSASASAWGSSRSTRVSSPSWLPTSVRSSFTPSVSKCLTPLTFQHMFNRSSYSKNLSNY
jgi:hypothetical protein